MSITRQPFPTTGIAHAPPAERITIGWREWVALPDLGLPAIKSKTDTGAKTSALHAFEIERFTANADDWVRFTLHPLPHNDTFVATCEAKLLGHRAVTNSGGRTELRYVIQTTLALGDHSWPIELTLTERDRMRFRMLLGRRALHGRALVDPDASYVHGRRNAKRLYGLTE